MYANLIDILVIYNLFILNKVIVTNKTYLFDLYHHVDYHIIYDITYHIMINY